MIELRIDVNGKPIELTLAADTLLVDVLQNFAELRGVRIGCETGDCGACTVLMDGEVAKSCLVLAGSADGTAVTTIEGLKESDTFRDVQQRFVDSYAFQCGFCLPGMLLGAFELVSASGTPSREAAQWALSGNLCRCTGYQRMVDATHEAARQQGHHASSSPKSIDTRRGSDD